MVLHPEKIFKRKTMSSTSIIYLNINFLIGNLSINLSVDESPYKVDASNGTVQSVPENNPLPAAAVPAENDIWYHV
jgi:cytochrome bd-type quinol oxidase subunit 1